jgi:8-oxo-dGTP diphosphatase
VKREYPDHPIVGVGAIIIKGEEVLLARRGKEPGYGKWSIPGGAGKLGETLEEAVIREVREEVNLAIRVEAAE